MQQAALNQAVEVVRIRVALPRLAYASIVVLAAILGTAGPTATAAASSAAVAFAQMSRSAVASTQVVAFRALANNRYVTAGSAGSSPLIASRTTVGAGERFEVTTIGKTDVSIRAQVNRRYVCADAAGSSPLISNRSAVGPWETFQLIKNSDGTVSLRSRANGRIVTAENAGNSSLIANRSIVGPWEKFTLVPQTTPTAPPTSGSRPGPGNTGPTSGSLLKKASSRTVTTAGSVLSGLDISGTVIVAASNVRITNSRVHGSGYYGVLVKSGNVVIENTEIYGFENGIAGDNWRASRVDIHSTTGDGVKFGSNVVLEDSWVHDLNGSAGAHADGGQMQSGVTNLIVRRNNIDMSKSDPSNAALFLAPDLGPSTAGPVTIDGNWLNGGNYTLFCVDGDNGRYFVKKISITNNKFGRQSSYGPARINVPITQSGNVWADTGKPLSLS